MKERVNNHKTILTGNVDDVFTNTLFKHTNGSLTGCRIVMENFFEFFSVKRFMQ